MTVLPIKMPPGVVRGATPNDTPGRWYDTNLIRWRQGAMEPVGGWVEQSATNLPFTDRVRGIHRWRDNSNLLRTLVFTDAEVRAYSSSSGYVDVSPTSLVSLGSAGDLPVGYGVGIYGAEAYGEPRSEGSENLSVLVPMWSWDNWGEDVLMVNSADGRLLVYDVTNPSTAVIPDGEYTISTISRTSNVATVTTSTNHFLTTGDIVAISGVTDANFDDASTSVTVTGDTTFTYTNTGSNTSSSGGTVLADEVPTSNRGVIVTEERHAVLLQAGGNPRRVAWSSREDYTDWEFSSTTNTAGFLELECQTPIVTAAPCRAGILIFTETEVFLMRFVGSPFVYGVELLQETRLLGPRLLAHDNGVVFWWSADGFFASDGTDVRPIPCPVWDFVCSSRCASATPALGFASDHGTYPEIWFFYPSNGETEPNRYLIFNWTEGWWAIGALTRRAMAPAIGGEYVIMADSSNYLYYHDRGWAGGNVTRDGDVYAETSVLNVPVGGERNFEINQAMIASGNATSELRVTFKTKQTPQGDERSFGPYSVRDDGYIDCRVTGRDVRVKVEALGDVDWSVGEMRLDVAAGAKR